MSSLHPLFITPVFFRSLPDFEHLIPVIEDLCQKGEKIASRDSSAKKWSTVGGWNSRDNLHENPDFFSLRDKIIIFSENAFKHMAVADDYEPAIKDMWAVINKPGDYNSSHVHSRNYLSGVFYLKVPENSGSLIFYDPRAQAEIISPPKKKNEPIGLSHWGNWDPKENDLILFPAYLRHGVETNNSKEDRIVVSFNIIYQMKQEQ